MLPPDTFAFLLGVLCVARGAETSLPILTEQGNAANVFANGEGPSNRDGNPHLDVSSVGIDDDGPEDEENGGSELSRTPRDLLSLSLAVGNAKPPSVIDWFVADIVKRIKSSRRLRNAFDLRQLDARNVSAITYDVIFTAAVRVGSPDARVSAQVVADSITASFQNVKRDSLIYILAKTIGNSLFYRDVLKASNAAELSKKLYDALKSNVDRVTNPNPEAYLRAIGAGTIGYLTGLGQFTPSTIPLLSLAFATQWRALGLPRCR